MKSMFRRLVSTFVMVVLVAPAIAMCAGTVAVAQAVSHDCCPKEAVAANAVPAPAMNESCCRMSDEAGQRVPTQATPIATAPLNSAALPSWSNEAFSDTRTLSVVTAPRWSDHVPRHLLLSVLII